MALKGNQAERGSAGISGDDSCRFLLSRAPLLSRHFKNSRPLRCKRRLHPELVLSRGFPTKHICWEASAGSCTQQLREEDSIGVEFWFTQVNSRDALG